MSTLWGRWNTWLKWRLRDWLEIPTRIPNEQSISSIAQASYRVWQQRFEEGMKDRENDLKVREEAMRLIAADLTRAVVDVMTQIQLAEKNWQAVVESQEKDKEETD